ncbi:MAG: site-specific DNA-methyltransferase [Pirellulales bacterium]
MEKLKMHSPDLTQANIEKLAELFPNCVTEARGEDGVLKRVIDFDQLRQELSDHIVEGPRERYQLNWPGKREALLAANAPIAKTLRPCREESVDFDTTKNLFIEGDNLDALKLLQETYLNKVKMIYIDPPYNTGHDFVYDDDFADDTTSYMQRSLQTDEIGNRLIANTDANGRFHSDWLSMIYSRLKLARSLLADDGLIFISIDDGEQASLKRVCDEIFGEENFVDPIIWKKRYGGGAKEKYLVALHEYVLVYARCKPILENFFIPLSEESIKRYYKSQDKNFETRGPYRTHPLEAMKSFDARDNLRFPIVAPDGSQVWPKRQWRWGQARVAEALERDEIEFSKDREGNWVLSSKQYLNDDDGETRGTKPFTIIDDVFTQHGTNEIVDLFGNAKVFDFPKPSVLLIKLITIALNGAKDGIILDFFGGSATTGHAVFELNALDGGHRMFVLVQLPEVCDNDSEAKKAGYTTIAEIGKKRLQLGAERLKSLSGLLTDGLDLGFRVLKIDTSNMKDVYYKPDAVKKEDLFAQVENIKEDRTPEDLLFQVMLDWGLDLAYPIKREAIDDKTVYYVDTNALAACFDLGITEELVKKMAAHKPLRAVFRDAGFESDSVKINVEQIFKLISPGTEVKTI